MNTSIIQIIQTMLVPGVMVSACALLLLGMNNKYSSIINRIRLLKDEDRRLAGLDAGRPPCERRENIAVQLPLLMARLKLIRNTVTAYSIGIILFIFSSFFIGLQSVSQSRAVQAGVVGFFIAGMVSVLAGAISNAIDARQAFTVVKLEAAPESSETDI